MSFFVKHLTQAASENFQVLMSSVIKLKFYFPQIFQGSPLLPKDTHGYPRYAYAWRMCSFLSLIRACMKFHNLAKNMHAIFMLHTCRSKKSHDNLSEQLTRTLQCLFLDTSQSQRHSARVDSPSSLVFLLPHPGVSLRVFNSVGPVSAFKGIIFHLSKLNYRTCSDTHIFYTCHKWANFFKEICICHGLLHLETYY